MVTSVPIFTADQWAQRLLRLYPNKWSGDTAKVAGGVLYSLFKSFGTEYNSLQVSLNWVLDACRISTAQDTALDAIANDFFGTYGNLEADIKRQPGEPNDSFRARIYANLLQEGGRRADIIRVVELLTGQVPRVIEPWNILDTAACDSFSFCDIDTVGNPCRVGSLGMAYQGFVESVLPSFGDNGTNPVYCIDEGLSCDRSFIIDPQPTWFLGEKELDNAINRVRMFGTVVWRRYGAAVTVNYARGNSPYVSSGATGYPVSLSPPSAEALIVLACATWNTSVSVDIVDEGDFTVNFGATAPGGKTIDWIAAPASVPGYGILSMTTGNTTASIAVPAQQILLATPSWETEIWLTAQESGTASFEFSNPAPAGSSLYYGTFISSSSGTQTVPSGTSTPITVDFVSAINNPYQLIVMPGWNTAFEITKTNTGFSVTFETAPSSDSFFCWGILNQPL